MDELQAFILFITHDIEEAIYLSGRIYILSEGPERVKEKIIVDLPKPRPDDIITTEPFNAIKRHMLDRLLI